MKDETANMNDYLKIKIIENSKHILDLKYKAKNNMRTKLLNSVLSKNDNTELSIDVAKEISKLANVCRTTVCRYIIIKNKINNKTKKQLENGEISIIVSVFIRINIELYW